MTQNHIEQEEQKKIIQEWRSFQVSGLAIEEQEDIEGWIEDVISRVSSLAQTAERTKAENVIVLILPLAKGYAHLNPHESSQRYIHIAEDYLTPSNTDANSV